MWKHRCNQIRKNVYGEMVNADGKSEESEVEQMEQHEHYAK